MEESAEPDRRAAGSAGSGLHETSFAAAPVGLAVIAADGKTLRAANPYLCRLLGYTPGSLAGASLSKLVVDLRLPPAAGIQSWRRADGSRIDLGLRCSATDGDERVGAAIVAVVEAVDTDELVRAEQNRNAFAAAGLGEWRWEARTGQIALSRRAAQILGYPAGRSARWAAMQKGLRTTDYKRVHERVAAALARGESWEFESGFIRGDDGAEVTIGVRGEPVVDAGGLMTGMVGVVRNLTRHVETQRALREQEQRLRVAASLAELGIFEWHLIEDAAIWENDRMFEIFGRKPEDGSVGKGEFLNEILHPDDRKPFVEAIGLALREGGDGVLHASGRVRRHDTGSWRRIEMAGRFERTVAGHLPRRLIGVVADVTDRRQAQERQSLLIRELHHRVKNTLATVQAIVGSTARTASSIDSFYEAFVGRIKSLSHTHSVLTEDTWQTASLHGLLVNELRPYTESGTTGRLDETRVRLDGPEVDLPSEIAVPIGMAIHELTTNAAKHGALSTRGGRIAVAWELLARGEAGILRFEWRESDGPPVAKPFRQGFGSRLLQRVLTTQVQAEVRSHYDPDGFRLFMEAPLPARNAALNPLV